MPAQSISCLYSECRTHYKASFAFGLPSVPFTVFTAMPKHLRCMTCRSARLLLHHLCCMIRFVWWYLIQLYSSSLRITVELEIICLIFLTAVTSSQFATGGFLNSCCILPGIHTTFFFCYYAFYRNSRALHFGYACHMHQDS
jgi:hypothetical protein